jgi:hypothetical protein
MPGKFKNCKDFIGPSRRGYFAEKYFTIRHDKGPDSRRAESQNQNGKRKRLTTLTALGHEPENYETTKENTTTDTAVPKAHECD